MRDSDPRQYVLCEMCYTHLERRAITLFGNYVTTNPNESDPSVVGEYWAADGITVVDLYEHTKQEAPHAHE